MFATARLKSSPQELQKSPPSLWASPPIAVNCTTAGLPHHSQLLPPGAVSTETRRPNSLSGITYSPCSCRISVHEQTVRGTPDQTVNTAGDSTALRSYQKRAS